MLPLEGKRLLITGGTGSLGKILVRRLLSGEMGTPEQIVVFSRDEAKQHFMRLEYMQQKTATDEVIYRNFQNLLTFRIGDVRDFHSISSALREIDVVFSAAALKQVPTCEYFPYEAVRTNIEGPENIVRAIRELSLPIETVIGISTDKAAKPINVMGMTKAIQERIFTRANIECSNTRFVCVRYGNVLASRGSVIPLFHEQIHNGGPVTLTDRSMTRFLMSLDEAVDIIFAAVHEANPGETYIPQMPSARIIDLATVLIGDRPIEIQELGVRPGEKMHEILISEEGIRRTIERGNYYVVLPILPEIRQQDLPAEPILNEEYSSANNIITVDELRDLLRQRKLLVEDQTIYDGELLR